jgi:hypothetical protein
LKNINYQLYISNESYESFVKEKVYQIKVF